MKKIIAILFLISSPVFSANEFFRSITSGNWNELSTWEMSTNSGATWIAATLTPSSVSNIITIRNSNTVTVTANVSADQLTVDTGGTISLDPAVLFTLLNGAGTDLTVHSSGTVSGNGTFQTQGTVQINLRDGSAFLAALKVNTSTATVSDFTTPFNGKLYGSVTVDAGATLSSNTTSIYSLFIYGNLVNNGTITGTGISNKIKFFGASILNSGSITSPVFRFDSVTSVSGTGTYTGADIIVGRNGNVSLSNDVSFSHSSEFIVDTNGILSPNTRTLTLDDSDLEILSGGTVVNSGKVKAIDRVNIRPREGSFFNSDLNVAAGSLTWVYNSTTLNNAKVFGDITVDSGGNLSTGNLTEYILLAYGNVINNGIISHAGSFEFPAGNHTIEGSGVWTTETTVNSGAVVNVITDHNFFALDNKTGGTFNITNRTARFSKTNPIIQNGTFISANGVVEYNGTANQTISTVNIAYEKLKINNSAGTTLPANLTVNDTLSLVLGDMNITNKILTLGSNAYLSETPGNSVFATTGYVTATRNLNSPSALNVAGIGAVLTTGVNLGSTEIRRGNAIQNGLNGGTSIARYFDIMPTVNDGLDASMTFKYDDSELNGKPESSLKLFYSTNTGSTWILAGGNPNPAGNSISVSKINSFSRWSSDTNSVSMVLNIAMEGFYNPVSNRLNMRDTLRAYLRNTVSPYGVVDSSKTTVDSVTFSAAFRFTNAGNGTYYIQTKHRNSIETWSRLGGEVYTVGNTLNYNFTSSASKAFGNNQIQIDASPVRFGIYAADVNQDGTVDLTDGSLIDNDASNFVTGYVSTDANGDDIVDLADAVLADNNGLNFISKITP